MAAPVRMCRVCRRRALQAELTRWVQGPEGPLKDPAGRMPGRGFYTCSPACGAALEKIKTKR